MKKDKQRNSVNFSVTFMKIMS